MSKREAMLRGLCLRWGVKAMERMDSAAKVGDSHKFVRASLLSSANTLDDCRAELETVLGIRNSEPPETP